jgi:hypothetical protein
MLIGFILQETGHPIKAETIEPLLLGIASTYFISWAICFLYCFIRTIPVYIDLIKTIFRKK